MRTTDIPTQKTSFVIIYENRFPIQQRRSDGSWGCRGCGGAIPKGRQTWCSNECVQTFHPSSVIFAAKQRDKEVCSSCGYDARAAQAAWWQERAEVDKLFRSSWTPNWKPGDPQPNNSEYHRRFREWQGKNKPRKIEYDHIVPFAEGGLTVLENMRSLCEVCHKQRTKRWHKDRKQGGTMEMALTSVGDGSENHLAAQSKPKLCSTPSSLVIEETKDCG